MAQVASEVRSRYGYQTYIVWLECKWGLKQRMANNLLAVARLTANFAVDSPALWEHFAPSAIYVMASPSTPSEAIEEALGIAEAGESVSHAVARGIVSRLSRMRTALDGASEQVTSFVTQHSIDDPELVEDIRRLERSDSKPDSNHTFSEIMASGGFHYGDNLDKWCDVTTAPAKTRYEALRSIAIAHANKDTPEEASPFALLIEAAKGLLNYRENAGASGFQLEKADDYLIRMRAALEALEARRGSS